MAAQLKSVTHKNVRYIVLTPEDVRTYSWQLAAKVAASATTFKPTLLLALWRGGAQVGVYVQEYLKRVGIEVDHVCVRTSSYTAPGEQSSTINVHTLRYVVEKLKAQPECQLLIVDDIFDSGKSLKAVIDKLEKKVGGTLLPNIKIATLFWKPKKNKTSLVPDYCVVQNEISDAWIVLPHEISDFTEPEDVKAIFGRQVFEALYPQSITNSAELSPEFCKKLAEWDTVNEAQWKAVREEPALIQSSSGLKIADQ